MTRSFVDSTTGIPNLARADLVPPQLHKVFIETIRVLDGIWSPVLTDIMPKKRSPSDAPKFTWPVMVDPMPMARFYRERERVQYMNIGVTEEQFWTRIIKSGFYKRSDEFAEFFADGLISEKYTQLSKIALQSIERRVEYELANYLFGNLFSLRQFTNMDTGRLKKIDLDSTDDGLTGTKWDVTATADPFTDIATINKLYGDLYGGELARMFVGRNTSLALEKNSEAKDRKKYVVDTTGGVMGAAIQGLAVKKVNGQRYKSASANSGRVGEPGLGHLRDDIWDDRNKNDMMVDSNDYEWVLFAPSDAIGFTFHSRIHNRHDNAQSIFSYTWEEDDPEFITYTRYSFAFAPAVEDFGKYIVATNAAQVV